HAVVAVELAAGRLRIDMASRQHHGCRGIASGSRREDVACAVDLDPATGFFEPADDEITPLAVDLGEGEPTHASLRRGADLGEFHERSPKAFAVDSNRG